MKMQTKPLKEFQTILNRFNYSSSITLQELYCKYRFDFINHGYQMAEIMLTDYFITSNFSREDILKYSSDTDIDYINHLTTILYPKKSRLLDIDGMYLFSSLLQFLAFIYKEHDRYKNCVSIAIGYQYKNYQFPVA